MSSKKLKRTENMSHIVKGTPIMAEGKDRRTSTVGRKGWDTRHHVVNSTGTSKQKHFGGSKKLPPPPEKFKARHGGSIKPTVDTGRDWKSATRIHRPNSAQTDPPYSSSSSKSARKGSKRESKKTAGGSLTVRGLANKTLQDRRLKSLKTMIEKDASPPSQADPKTSRQNKNRFKLSINIEDKADGSSPAKSTGKSLDRSFAKGLALNLVDVSAEEAAQIKSFDLSQSGTIDLVGFKINELGIAEAPGCKSVSTNISKNLVKLCMLGKGASGVVHKAVHVPTLQIVAVKVIPVFETEKRRQLVTELKSLYSNMVPLSENLTPASAPIVACPHIVAFYDAFMDPDRGNMSVVVEYMDGGSLQDIVDTGGCPSESVLANISYHVLKGLQFIHHRHQIHRDIKPGNLLIDHRGRVKVSDFGIVRDMESTVANAQTFVGTLCYMSPERISGEDYSYNSDIWSFGLAIMTCAMGKFPYSTKGGYWELMTNIRENPVPLLPSDQFSPEFLDFVSKCLEKDKDLRWSTEQLLSHQFLATYDDDNAVTSPSNGAQAEFSESVNAEVLLIAEGIMKHFLSEASAMAKEQRMPLEEVVSWAKSLPPMQPRKLSNLASQLGISYESVRVVFESQMNELLDIIQSRYY